MIYNAEICCGGFRREGGGAPTGVVLPIQSSSSGISILILALLSSPYKQQTPSAPSPHVLIRSARRSNRTIPCREKSGGNSSLSVRIALPPFCIRASRGQDESGGATPGRIICRLTLTLDWGPSTRSADNLQVMVLAERHVCKSIKDLRATFPAD